MNEQLEECGDAASFSRPECHCDGDDHNTYLFYDTLFPLVGSVIAVHPPNVRLVTGVKVKTDKKAALSLAQLHAAGCSLECGSRRWKCVSFGR